MAACWRGLAAHAGVDLHVVSYGGTKQTSFDDDLMSGISWIKLTPQQRTDTAYVGALVERLRPDAIVICGWLNQAYRKLTLRPKLNQARFLMGMDTPWRGTLRQRGAGIALRPYLSRFDSVVVSGERAWQYAVRLGISEERIQRGLYGIDYAGLSSVFYTRAQHAWPRRFLFAGRYAPEKAIDVLIAAYRLYRAAVEDPWQLLCCGMGPLQHLVEDEPGVSDYGFVQPVDMRQILAQAGALLLPSRFDPWPLALVEACATGLPVIATNACGSGVECLRDNYNGFFVASGNARAFGEALIKIHHRYDQMEEMGKASQNLAAPYAVEFWLDRWLPLLDKAGVS